MRTDSFDYDLPDHLIAQAPCPERDQSKLLVVERNGSQLSHRLFQDLPDLLRSGDMLVLNDTRVLPARLFGRRTRTGGRWEGLFLRQFPDGIWEMMCQTRGRLLVGETIIVEPGPLQLKLLRKAPDGHWLARPSETDEATQVPGSPVAILERFGHVPLPPYVRKGKAGAMDRDRYQTVFARVPGAVAAPTAGLHFTPRLFDALDAKGIGKTFVTLHVGLGTFQPLQVENVAEHQMHSEWGELSEASAASLNACKARGGRIVAVGTTTVRVLESAARNGTSPELLPPWSGETDLYIYPPYTFRAVDALVTNFHLPRTSLLVLVSAFGGIDTMQIAYKTAVDRAYRFYSYGDAMLIV